MSDPIGCEACDRHPPVLSGSLPWTNHGQPIVVWSGNLHRPQEPDPPDPASVQGQLSLVWRRSFRMEWTATDAAAIRAWRWADRRLASPQFLFEYAGTKSALPVNYLDDEHGWTNGGTLGNNDAQLTDVTFHLINLPKIHGAGVIHDHTIHRSWTGRWETNAADWQLTIDERADHNAEFQAAGRDGTFTLTHVASLSRPDGATFTTETAAELTYAIQAALSFAVGYWIGVAGVTGHDINHVPAWCEVGAPHTGIAQRGTGWWNDTRPQDLADYLSCFLANWHAPKPTDPLRFAVTASILGNATGFVEQRIITALAALETLSWSYEVIEHGRNEKDWGRSSPARLRRLLRRMTYDPAFTNAPGSDAVSRYGRSQNHHDLAETVAAIRNRISHPKPDHDIYAYDGALLQAWRLSTMWLELAILHRLGYTGHYSDRTVPGRAVGQSDSVPWVDRIDGDATE